MPSLKINKKLERLFTAKQQIIVLIGGRGSGKSIAVGDFLTFKMGTEAADIYCLREFQDSVADSVHRVFADSVQKRLKLEGWDVQESKVTAPNGARTVYKGANRNPDSMQSAQGFKYSWFEEAHRASKSSLDKLLPTILRNPGAKCIFTANPQSSRDPFSQRFITPYLKQLERDGYYEDDLHLILVVNWRDNPWWNEEQERLRMWDYENRPRSEYDWIWEGKFNDSVERALIKTEWFDACVDAHKKLGFDVSGGVTVTHDPSDVGDDAKAVAARKGVVFTEVKEIQAANANVAFDLACEFAHEKHADSFGWDCDGMGALLREQATRNFANTKTNVYMFKGSEAPHGKEQVLGDDGAFPVQSGKKVKDVFKNKRAQNYVEVANRCYKTYLAVTQKKYIDPDQLISFSSECEGITALRSELCSLPLKPSGGQRIELYSKDEMRKGIIQSDGNRRVIPSPNLADCVMMSFDKDSSILDNVVEDIEFDSFY